MDIRVAVASSDGRTVNLHFGRADDQCEFLEERAAPPLVPGSSMMTTCWIVPRN
jgi:hypothetical protein